MTQWSKPAHKFANSIQEKLPEDFKFGIEISLGQLIEMRNKPIIQWIDRDARVKTNRIGGFRSRFKGRGMDFDESRIYQIGDDIRNIDWKVTARTGVAHTKLFKEERERPVFVILDQMPGMFFGTAEVFKSVVASKVAAQLMWNTLANGDRFGAMLFAANQHLEMKPSSSRRNCMRLLNRIVESHQQVLSDVFSNNKGAGEKNQQQNTTQQSNDQFAATLKRLKHIAKPGSLVHIISDFNQFDEHCQRQLSNLSQHTDIHCLLVSDPIEKELPPAGLYGITDGLNNGFLNTQQTDLRKSYHQQFIDKLENVKNFSLSHRGIFTHIDTNYQQNSIGQQSNSPHPLNQAQQSKGERK